MTPTYESIQSAAFRILHEVRAAGHNTNLCVWEFSLDVWNVVVARCEPHITVIDPSYVGKTAYMGIPVRIIPGTEYLLLKRVNMEIAQ